MSDRLLAYVENDNVLEVDKLTDVDGTYVNNATVTCTEIRPAAGGDDILGGPVTLTYVTASNGRYRATLQDTLALVADVAYEAIVTVDATALQAQFHVPFTARKRTTR